MEAPILILALVILLDVAALRWGADSRPSFSDLNTSLR